MSLSVVADLNACQGYVCCVIEAPEIFDVDDDGKVRVLQVNPSGDQQSELAAAVRSCPARALSLREDG